VRHGHHNSEGHEKKTHFTQIAKPTRGDHSHLQQKQSKHALKRCHTEFRRGIQTALAAQEADDQGAEQQKHTAPQQPYDQRGMIAPSAMADKAGSQTALTPAAETATPPLKPIATRRYIVNPR